MARYRILKPETFADEKLAEVSVHHRYLFVGLWCFADDMGRKAYSPRRIQSEVFPTDEEITTKLIDKWLRDLARIDLIRTYTVDGKEYIWIPRFLRHQRIDRPSHSYLPPHPDEREPQCCCAKCRIAAGDSSLVRHENELFEPHNYARKKKGNNVPRFTRRALDESSTTRRSLDEASGRIGMEWNGVSQSQIQHQHQEQNQEQHQPLEPVPVSKREERRANQRDLEQIAMRMLDLLQVTAKPLIVEALTRSIELKAKNRQCSLESAAQQIAARAAFVAAESPPEDWGLWFQDVGHEYFAQGDQRLNDRSLWSRPTCGSQRCQEGWEPVRTGEIVVLRRCPDCAKLWADLGL